MPSYKGPCIVSITYGYYLDTETIQKIVKVDCLPHRDPLSYKLEKLNGVKGVKYPHNEIGIEITLYDDDQINQDLLWTKIASIINNHLKEAV